jgi:flagellar biosynthesis/type III secretory pathway protein FliH
MNSARVQAEEIINGARQEAQEIRQRERERGFAEGLQQILAQALQSEVRTARLLESMTDALLEMLLNLSEEIIGETLPSLPGALASRIRRALAVNPLLDNHCRIVVHSDDVARVQGELQSQGITNIDVEADIKRSSGTARIETAHGALEIDHRRHFHQVCEHLRSSSRVRNAFRSHLLRQMEDNDKPHTEQAA